MPSPPLTIADLLTRGFFHDRIVPPLNSLGLAPAVEEIAAYVSPDMRTRPRHRSIGVPHSVPKHKHLRRKFSIPNPYSHAMLCVEVAEHWTQLHEICEKSPISMSVPTVSGKRALTARQSRREATVRRAETSVGARYLLRTDFANFYPSIYTHSVPWAIHGKTEARADTTSRLYGNRIDKWIRETQDKQTGGIPIGPDTSFLIAEVVASRIDIELQSEIGRPLTGTRYIDDFHLYFESRAEAESALAALHRVSQRYELQLNDSKTEIIELPEPLEPSWKTTLRLAQLTGGQQLT